MIAQLPIHTELSCSASVCGQLCTVHAPPEAWMQPGSNDHFFLVDVSAIFLVTNLNNSLDRTSNKNVVHMCSFSVVHTITWWLLFETQPKIQFAAKWQDATIGRRLLNRGGIWSRKYAIVSWEYVTYASWEHVSYEHVSWVGMKSYHSVQAGILKYYINWTARSQWILNKTILVK